jgi:hypothetical protein
MRRIRILTHLIFAAAFIPASGCMHNRNPAGEGAEQAVHTYKFLPTGRILSVNPAHEYAIVECVTIPEPGQEVRIYSGSHIQARLVITSQIRGVFAAADIVEGTPNKNDLIWMKHVNIESSDRGEQP